MTFHKIFFRSYWYPADDIDIKNTCFHVSVFDKAIGIRKKDIPEEDEPSPKSM
jgi:hypothetical protein